MSEYTKSIVTFIDILGFGDLVRNKTAEEMSEIIRITEESSQTEHWQVSSSGRRSVTFSDTIISSCPLVGPMGPQCHGLLFDEIMTVMHLQVKLMDKADIFVRGALTIGDIHHDEEAVYGPAVIDGYEIESKLCNFPRVVIDPKVLQAFEDEKSLRTIDHHYEDDSEIVEGLLRQDTDGLWFVDYLSAILRELDDPEYYLTILKKHKQLILRKAAENKKLNSIALKYNWLASYHNKVVNEMLEKRALSAEHDRVFLITAKELETMHQFKLSESNA